VVLIGLLLLVAAAVFGIDLVAKNRFAVRNLDLFGSSVGIHSASRLFVLGAITGAVVLLGVVLIVAGLGRKGSRAASRRRERRRTAAAISETETVRAQNVDLRQQLDTRSLDDARLEGREEEREGRTP
jgi:hypothetical protein